MPETSCRQSSPAMAPPSQPSGSIGPLPAEEQARLGVAPFAATRRVRRTAVIAAAEECICCGVCVDVCPVGAITMEDHVLIDAQKCVGCGLCTVECPNDILVLAESKPVESGV